MVDWLDGAGEAEPEPIPQAPGAPDGGPSEELPSVFSHRRRVVLGIAITVVVVAAFASAALTQRGSDKHAAPPLRTSSAPAASTSASDTLPAGQPIGADGGYAETTDAARHQMTYVVEVVNHAGYSVDVPPRLDILLSPPSSALTAVDAFFVPATAQPSPGPGPQRPTDVLLTIPAGATVAIWVRIDVDCANLPLLDLSQPGVINFLFGSIDPRGKQSSTIDFQNAFSKQGPDPRDACRH